MNFNYSLDTNKGFLYIDNVKDSVYNFLIYTYYHEPIK